MVRNPFINIHSVLHTWHVFNGKKKFPYPHAMYGSSMWIENNLYEINKICAHTSRHLNYRHSIFNHIRHIPFSMFILIPLSLGFALVCGCMCVCVCARAVNQWLTEAYQKRLNILWNRRFEYIYGIVCICTFFSSVIWKMLLWLKRLKKWVGIQFFASRISHEMSHWMEFIARSSHFSFFHTSLFFLSHSLPTIFIFPFGSSVKMFSCIFIKTRNSIWLHRLMNRVTSDAIK